MVGRREMENRPAQKFSTAFMGLGVMAAPTPGCADQMPPSDTFDVPGVERWCIINDSNNMVGTKGRNVHRNRNLLHGQLSSITISSSRRGETTENDHGKSQSYQNPVHVNH
jgi:hypothetical protein